MIGIGTNYALKTNMTCHRSVNSGHKWPPQAKAMREKRFKQRKNVGERKNVCVRIGARACACVIE